MATRRGGNATVTMAAERTSLSLSLSLANTHTRARARDSCLTLGPTCLSSFGPDLSSSGPLPSAHGNLLSSVSLSLAAQRESYFSPFYCNPPFIALFSSLFRHSPFFALATSLLLPPTPYPCRPPTARRIVSLTLSHSLSRGGAQRRKGSRRRSTERQTRERREKESRVMEKRRHARWFRAPRRSLGSDTRAFPRSILFV
jgi:hypothetical protein